MADAYTRAIDKVTFRDFLDAISPTPVVGDVVSGLLGLYDTGKGLLGDYKAAQEKDPRKMIRGMAGNVDNYTSGLLNAASVVPLVSPAIAGMFIGKNSKVWDALKADEAQKMLAKGVDPKEVWKKTGTFKGVDGALRQEIDDSASIPGHRLYSWGEREDLKQGNSTVVRRQKALLHPKLSAAYPETKTIPVFLKPGSESGSFANDPSFYGPQITAGASRENGAANKSVMLHELQHAIQEREGWARGGDVNNMPKILDEIAKQKFDESSKFVNEAYSGDPLNLSDLRRPGQRDKAAKLSKEAYDLKAEAKRLRDFPELSFDRYKKLAGEAEARLTQSRMNMTMPERLQVYPYDMLDVPQDQLIVRGLLRR